MLSGDAVAKERETDTSGARSGDGALAPYAAALSRMAAAPSVSLFLLRSYTIVASASAHAATEDGTMLPCSLCEEEGVASGDVDSVDVVNVVPREDGSVSGVMQVDELPGLTYRGGTRTQLEGIRVHERDRRCGLGHWMVRAAIDRARRRGSPLVQLTTDTRRGEDVHDFYQSLGFAATHTGFKLRL